MNIREFLKNESQELVNEFNKASILGEGTPQEISDFRENYFKKFMKRFFPLPYKITKGKIVDSYGETSDSIDCLILNPIHPLTVDTEGKFSIIFADGVDFAIEIKPDISDKNELFRGLKQISSVKKLTRAKSPVASPFQTSKEIIDYSRKIPTCIFTLKSKKNIKEMVKDIKNYYLKEQIQLEFQFDYIVINNVGILSNYKISDINPYPQTLHIKEGFRANLQIQRTGIHFEFWNEYTIIGMLLHINNSFPSTLRISTPILTYYIKEVIPSKIRYFPEISEVLYEIGKKRKVE